MNKLVLPGPDGAADGADTNAALSSDTPFLRIALVNNMPDAAMAATERHFCKLLASASAGLLVNLKFYALPGLQRGEAASSRIRMHYDHLAELRDSPPDGIIISGAEPHCADFRKEPYWPELSWLIDWIEEHSIPSVWSCLAAHAAVFHMDGIKRNLIDTKLSGLFDCRVAAHRHHITRGLPSVWRVPHSRHYGLRERDLISCGYTILSRSKEVGADIFVRQGNALQLFFQGHPEYAPTTLLAEYRRDLAQYMAGARATRPVVPKGYSIKSVADLHNEGDVALAHQCGELPNGDWSGVARKIYGNWIAYLCDRRSYRLPHMFLPRCAEAADHGLPALPSEQGF